MLKKTLDSISYQTDKFIRDNIHVNQSYMALKWNGFEKILVSGSKYYVKAIFILISFFAAIFIVMVSGKSYIKPFVAEWFPKWNTLLDAQINLLGGQLTIIGIVYPMVVGLVSVIFQRKSARKIVHAAYQTYSGFMLAGLSGLCLSGFMLCGLLLRTFVGNYNYAIICGISIIWMMLNIALSVWFFVQSLSVLDDEKRERMVLRYLTADILSAHVKSQLHNIFLKNPVKSKIIKNDKYSNLTIEDYSFEKDYSAIRSEASMQEVLKDIYVRPFKIIIWLINMYGRLKKKQITIALFSKLESRDEFETLPLFKVKNIKSDHVLISFLTHCFRTGIVSKRNISTDRIIKGLLGDAIDALASVDINAFDEAIEGFCRDITTFTDGFNFKQGQQTDNLLLLADDIFWDRSFTDELYTELYQLFRQVVIRIDISERFYAKCMNVPRMLCSKRENISLKEIQLALRYTFYSWDILVRWGHANAGRLDLTQRQSYEALLMDFVEIWEGWTDGLGYISKKTGGQQLYHDTLKEHLFTLPDIVACAVLSGESSSVDWAVDLMNRWLHTARSSADSYNTLFSWQEFIVTQATLDGEIVFSQENTPLRKPVELSQLLDSFYKNTLTDLRLLTAAFIISKPDAVQNTRCQFAVSALLDGSLVENTGGFERLSEGMTKSSDIIDVFIRLLIWDKADRGEAINSPGSIIRKLSSAHGKSLVSGRTYMGRRLGGVEDLISQIAELSVLRCGDINSVSPKMKAIVASNLLSYHFLEKIVRNLASLHNAINKLTGAAFVAEDVFTEQRQKMSDLIQEYLDVFNNEMQQSIIQSPVSETILENAGKVISELFSKKIANSFPFKLFSNISVGTVVDGNIMRRISFQTDKQDVTDKFARKIHGLEENRASALINEHVFDLLSLLSRQPSQQSIGVTSFSELLSMVHDYDELQEDDYLIVCDERLWNEYNEYRANTLDSVEGKADKLFYDEDRNLKIRGKEKSCSLYISPHFDSIDTLLVNKNYFEEYKIKSEGDSIFNFNAKEVDGNPLEIALHSQYEGEAVFSGQIKVRFILCKDSFSLQALPGEDAS